MECETPTGVVMDSVNGGLSEGSSLHFLTGKPVRAKWWQMCDSITVKVTVTTLVT